MATEMFGGSPDELRQALLNQRAAQFAAQTPQQQLGALAYKGGAGVGQALGGLFGVDVTPPEVRRLQQRQSLMQSLDLTSPESLKQGIQAAMQSNDYTLASELNARLQATAKAALEGRKTEAETQKALREKQATGLNEKVFAALAAKATPASVKAAQDAGNDISLLQVPENVKVSTYGQILKDAGIPEGSPEFQKQMQAFAAAELESTRKGKGTTVTTLVGQAPKIAESVDAFDKTVAPYRATYDTAATARTLLNEASASNNSQAFEAARTTLAKAIGENKLSNEDIRRTGIDPRLIAGALDWVNKKIEGVPNQDIIRQMYAVSTALQQKAGQQINEKADRAQSVAKASKFEGDLQTFFPKIPVPGAPDQDKEARYQAWKKTQQTPKGF